MPTAYTPGRSRTETVGRERSLVLSRFGGRAELRVQPAPGCTAQAQQRLDRAAALLAEIDRTLTRFDAASELSELNADPRHRVPATPLMVRFAEAVGWAARRSGGLVDATCLTQVERAGYRHHFVPTRTGPAEPPAVFQRVPISPLTGERFDLAPDDPADDPPMLTQAWRDVEADPGHVHRPAGVRLDSGGIGKGLAADLAADLLRGAPAWMVDCGGDLRIGGTARMPRAVDVRDPVDPSQLIHRLHITRGAVATSGVTRRSWDRGGTRSHHLIDPRTGRPADTGVLQVTALAPTALEAEVIAKTALLHGVAHAHRQLPHGGVVVAEHGCVTVVPPPRIEQARRARSDRATFQVSGRAPVTRALRSR